MFCETKLSSDLADSTNATSMAYESSGGPSRQVEVKDLYQKLPPGAPGLCARPGVSSLSGRKSTPVLG